MAIDTNRLVQIAAELKELDQRRERLLVELQRIAGGIEGAAPAARRRGRPPGSRNQAKPAAPTPGRKPRKSVTTDIVEFLKSRGGAHTAGEIIAALKLPKTKRQNWSVSNALVRLLTEGRAKNDKVRGYRAA
jgi:hypothetical protein